MLSCRHLVSTLFKHANYTHDLCVYDVLYSSEYTVCVFLCYSEFVSTAARLKNFPWPQWYPTYYPKGHRFDTVAIGKNVSACMHTQSNIKKHASSPTIPQFNTVLSFTVSIFN